MGQAACCGNGREESSPAQQTAITASPAENLYHLQSLQSLQTANIPTDLVNDAENLYHLLRNNEVFDPKNIPESNIRSLFTLLYKLKKLNVFPCGCSDGGGYHSCTQHFVNVHIVEYMVRNIDSVQHQQHIKQMLGNDWLTLEMDNNCFAKLQNVCKAQLSNFEAMLNEIYDGIANNDEKFNELMEYKDEVVYDRQDTVCPFTDDWKETDYIQLLLKIAAKAQKVFDQEMIAIFGADKYHGGYLKAFERMKNKSESDYAHEKFPSSAKNLDIVRGSINCKDVADLIENVEKFKRSSIEKSALSKNVNEKQTAGHLEIARVKNTFLTTADVTGGYRSFMLNVVINVDGHHKFTIDRAKDVYEEEYDDNSQKLYGLKMICELQFLLNDYLNVKKKMHTYYKIGRANTQKELWSDCARYWL